MTKRRIGYIDEDKLSRDMFGDLIDDFLSEYEYVELEPASSLEAMMSHIWSEDLSSLVIDHKLNTSFNGADIHDEVIKLRRDFPTFIFTGNDNDAIEHSSDPRHIYSKSFPSNDDNKTKFSLVIKATTEKYWEKVDKAEKRLITLCSLDEHSSKELAEIVELDNYLEANFGGAKKPIPKEFKALTQTEYIKSLIDRLF